MRTFDSHHVRPRTRRSARIADQRHRRLFWASRSLLLVALTGVLPWGTTSVTAATWTQANDLQGQTVNAVAASPLAPQHMLAGSAATTTYSADSGASWHTSSGVQGITVIAFDDWSPGDVYAGSPFGLFVSHDWGQSFAPFQLEAGSYGIAGLAIGSHYVFASLYFSPGQPTDIARATRAGVAEILSFPGQGPFDRPGPLAVETGPNLLYVGTRGTMFRSADDGTTFKGLAGTPTIGSETYQLVASGADVWQLSFDGLFVSTDGASTWTKTTATGGSCDLAGLHIYGTGFAVNGTTAYFDVANYNGAYTDVAECPLAGPATYLQLSVPPAALGQSGSNLWAGAYSNGLWFTGVLPPPLPSLPQAALQASALADPLLTRQMTVISATSGAGATYQYQWTTRASGPPTLGLPLQSCPATGLKTACTVDYSPANPNEVWHLWIRAVDSSGAAGLWTPATLDGSSDIRTPPPPILVALGDSVTSGHHEVGSPPGSTIIVCNDASYGYPEYVWQAFEQRLPEAWRFSGGYFNRAHSGISLKHILDGAWSDCDGTYPSGHTPIGDAAATLTANNRSWNRVVITGGVNDTNWVKVSAQIGNDSKVGLNPLFTPTACLADVNGWDGYRTPSTPSTLPAITANVRSIVAQLMAADPAAHITWGGYYNVSGTGRQVSLTSPGGTPIPKRQCDGPVGKAMLDLNKAIHDGLPSTVRWVDLDTVLHDNGSDIQPYYIATGLSSNQSHTGWPHPNPTGAKAIAQLFAF